MFCSLRQYVILIATASIFFIASFDFVLYNQRSQVDINANVQVMDNLNKSWSGVNDELLKHRNSMQELFYDMASHKTHSLIATNEIKTLIKPLVASISIKRAVLFTMDSIESYETSSLHGGAAGEIIMRKCLEVAFKSLNISLDILKSDAEFSRTNMDGYDIVIVDPWTWASKGISLLIWLCIFLNINYRMDCET